MLGQDLQYLASVAELAKVDLDPKAGHTVLSTRYKPDALAAQYISPYGRGCCWVQRGGGVPDDLEVEVEAQLLQQLARLFAADEDVRLVPGKDGNGLQLVSKLHRLKLGTIPTDGVVDVEPDLETYAVVDAQALAAELNLAFEFTAKSIAKLVLTGVRVSTAAGEVRLVAFNGFSMLFTSRVAGEPNDGRTSFILPARDGAPLLKLIRGGAVALRTSADGRHVVLAGDSSWARLDTLHDEGWPDFSPLVQQQERQAVLLPGAQLDAVLAAVKAFDADPYVRLSGSGEEGKTVLLSLPTERGQYVTPIEAAYSGEIGYDADNLGLVAKLGSDLQFEIATRPGVPTLVRAKERRVWLNPKVSTR